MKRLKEKLAVHGGTLVRETMLPYSRQSIDEADIQSVGGSGAALGLVNDQADGGQLRNFVTHRTH